VTEARLFDIWGLDIWAADLPGSGSAQLVAHELDEDCYGLERIDFAPGDLVLDVGAHVGLFAAYVGLRHCEKYIEPSRLTVNSCQMSQ